jgi:hypothetical protein
LSWNIAIPRFPKEFQLLNTVLYVPCITTTPCTGEKLAILDSSKGKLFKGVLDNAKSILRKIQKRKMFPKNLEIEQCFNNAKSAFL